tara:strand:- start:869 stop:1243 length:375 start_codon:yes stop_codon:yes gene_type:complete
MREASLLKYKKGEKKKYAVRIYIKGDQYKVVKFGQNGAMDFTLHSESVRDGKRIEYLRRHGGKPPTYTTSTKEDWSPKGIYTPGYWARWLLWEKPSIRKAIDFLRNEKKIDIIQRKGEIYDLPI